MGNLGFFSSQFSNVKLHLFKVVIFSPLIQFPFSWARVVGFLYANHPRQTFVYIFFVYTLSRFLSLPGDGDASKENAILAEERQTTTPKEDERILGNEDAVNEYADKGR